MNSLYQLLDLTESPPIVLPVVNEKKHSQPNN
ncbi:hypothetical protein LMG24235_08541 [Paraburkholderia sabiae]|nr:hypothetical protein LMG24235_08541 [Paraburkholderia sabiae]